MYTKFGYKKGKFFCTRHYVENFGEKCSICKKSLSKYVRTALNQILCTDCHGKCPSCFSCRRVAAQDTFKCFDDGRLACPRCFSSGVHKHEEVVDSMAAVQAFFASLGMQSFQKEEFQFLKMRLLDRPALMVMCKKNCHHAAKKCPLGVTLSLTQVKKTYTYAGEDRRVLTDVQKMCKVQGIGVLKGLPRTHMTAVLAHELGHAFFTLHKFPHLPHQVNEGTCELWAYLWLKHLATMSTEPEVREDANMHIERMQNNIDPVYGDGFRAALKGLSKVSNFIQFLKHIRRYNNFPS